MNNRLKRPGLLLDLLLSDMKDVGSVGWASIDLSAK